MDARIVKLALACCALGVARAAVAQDTVPEIVPWNLVGETWTYIRADSESGTISFKADGSDKIPAGSTSFVIEGDSCWVYEWCKGGTCAPTGDGSLEFAIASQSIVITFDGNLPTLPSGFVTFAVDVSQPTTVTWPGGTATIDPAAGYFEVPVAASASGFPILFSGPFVLRSIDTYMQVVTPGVSRYCNQGSRVGCEPYSYQEGCAFWSPFLGGSLAAECDIGPADGLLCVCGGYADIEARAVARASASLIGDRFDVTLLAEWGCGEFMYDVNSMAWWRLGLDRPTRLTWNYASCNMYSDVFGDQCGGPGSVDLFPQSMPYSYGLYHQFTLVLHSIGSGLNPSAEEGFASLRIENLRIERIFPADVIPDGIVDGSDISAILSKWGGPYDPQRTAADVNLDGQVGAEDLAAVLFAWGTPG